MDFPVAAYADMFEFRRAMTAPRHLGQAPAGFLNLSQHMVGALPAVYSQDIPIDIEYVLLGLRNYEHPVFQDSFFVRAARSRNALLRGLCLPASMLCWLWASTLSMARLSCVCS